MEEAFFVLHLRLFESETIALERAEDLFDAPSQSIDAHHVLSLIGALHRQGGEDAPTNRLDAFHQSEGQCLGIGARRGAWPLDRHAAGAQLDLREAAFVAWSPWRDLDGRDDQRGLTGESLKQCRSIGERTVVARPDRQIHLAWTMSQMVPDVPLLVIDHDHLGG